ncbi:MAG: sugar phosphate isomerase/epimerase [Clostridia bacterium]|nr:sugar phosphate isomerase/epimerase [Clostridia bacterium]
MFDISIGTIVPVRCAADMIPILEPKGFECFELDFLGENPAQLDWSRLSDSINSKLQGARISALGFYANPILREEDRNNLTVMIKNARRFGCNVIGAFAGGDPEKSVPENIPDFKRVWTPLVQMAEDEGVKIGLEGCGGGWRHGSRNIGFCSDAWELILDAVQSPALGLEWEPCHALEKLADPIIQLRRWADKVVHVHGKDGTVAWDVIAEHGIDSGAIYCWNRTPGFGDTNWADLFTILLQSGFRGACDIEGYHDPVHLDDMEWSAQLTALDYLKRCRGGVSWFDGPEYKGYAKRIRKAHI